MQERYLGDIHDFIKFSLLRKVAIGTKLRLGVNWYLTEPQEVDGVSNNDGEMRHHLTDSQWQALDRNLFEQLKGFSDPDERILSNFENSDCLPKNTLYFSEPVTNLNRDDWFNRSENKLSLADIVFLDPDNGLQVKSMTRSTSPKYALYSEIEKYYRSGKSVIVIQFLGRIQARDRIEAIFDKLTSQIGSFPKLPVIRGRSSPNILFFTIPTLEHVEVLKSTYFEFLKTGGSKIEVLDIFG